MNSESRKILETPFPPEEIRSRKGNFGKSLAYAEVHNYISRLNEAFTGNWSFDIVEHRVMETEVIVLGKLMAGSISKTAFGCSAITTCRDSDEPVSIGDDLKAAASDALKKCSSLLGLGLHLYGKELESAPGPKNMGQMVTFSGPGQSSGNGNTLTSRQYGAIISLADKGGYTEAQVKTRVLDIYGVPLEKLDRRQASEIISQLNNGNGKAMGGTT